MGSEMVTQKLMLIVVACVVAFAGVISMVAYFTLTIVGIWMYKVALREIETAEGRCGKYFLSEHSWPSRDKRVATFLFVIKARSSRLSACRRFGQFVYSAITPYVFVVVVLFAVGLLAQGVGFVLGLYRMLDGLVDYQKRQVLCMGIGVAYFFFSVWGIILCSRGLIRVRNLIRGSVLTRIGVGAKIC